MAERTMVADGGPVYRRGMDEDTKHLFITTHATDGMTLGEWYRRTESLKAVLIACACGDWGTVRAYGPDNGDFDWGSFCAELRISTAGAASLQEQITKTLAFAADVNIYEVVR